MAETFAGDLSGSRFNEVDLSGSRFLGVNLTNVEIEEAWAINLKIDNALLGNVVINGVEVAGYVVDQLRRTDPDRALQNPIDRESGMFAIETVDTRWSALIERARALPDAQRHQSVNDEWSFVQTLRHLVFGIDKWFTVPVLGGGFEPMGLPNMSSPHSLFPGTDPDASPTFDEAVAARAERVAAVRAWLASAEPADFGRIVTVIENGRAPVLACLATVIEEALGHLGYATRDLDILTG
jgi:hypothetical protein